jgi:hypothetical protein
MTRYRHPHLRDRLSKRTEKDLVACGHVIHHLLLLSSSATHRLMEKYKNFDFAKDQVWLEYAANIDKSISDKRLEYIKRRWYKANIDRVFC